jgi:Tfp pilus assembly protein PilF
LGRACAYNCLHEWHSAQQDCQTILAFAPHSTPTLLLRARIATCNREWDKARKDYEYILLYDPNNIQAKSALNQIVKFEPKDVLHVEH